ncbi:MAG: cyanophycin synthetase [Eubacteriales bacterium]
MKIVELKAMEGANYYSRKPVIRAVIDISDWKGKMTKDIKGFNEKLLQLIPTFEEHTCSKGRKGGFLERLEEGTFPGHVLEHTAIELLNLSGQNIRYGKTSLWNKKKCEYEVVIEYVCREAGLEAIRQACEILNRINARKFIDVTKSVEIIKKLITKTSPGPSTGAIVKACLKKGIPVQKIDGSIYQLGLGCFQKKIQAAMTDATSCIGVDIAGDKEVTRLILSRASIPVPRGKVVDTEEEIIRAFNSLGRNVVIKPCNGNQGKGVSVKLKEENEVLAAFRLAETYDKDVVIEEYVEGSSYRLLVIDNKVVAAAKRIPPYVTGNGKLNIRQLVGKENRNLLRGEQHEKFLTKILLDPVALLNLARKGINLDYVPSKGEKVYIRESANLSNGGKAEDVTDQVHPDNIELAVYAAKILGLDIAGIDLVLEDIGYSFKQQNGKVIEVNASPGLRMHLMPSRGIRRDIGENIVEKLFPDGKARIPIISVTGTNGKTTVVRILNKLLRNKKLLVGMTASDGIYINGKILTAGDMTGPFSARVVLGHPDVQVAVLETARGGILRGGLGYDYADVAVVTNVEEDHIGQDGIESIEEMANLKSLIAETVKKHSYVILNADNIHTAEMAFHSRGRVIFFTIHSKNRLVCKHLCLGGTAVIVEDNIIKLFCGAEGFDICSLAKVPIAWGGKAQHNIQNILAAVGASWALGFKCEEIAENICGFGMNFDDNRGRLEYYEYNGVKVFLDYGHNSVGVREVANTISKIKHRKLIGCIGLPGDRTDKAVRALAKEASKVFNRLFIKEDMDLRGRNKGEIAQIIYDEAVKQGMDTKRLSIVLDEKEAFEKALEECKRGDILVVFFEKLQPLVELLNKKIAENGLNNNISLEVK